MRSTRSYSVGRCRNARRRGGSTSGPRPGGLAAGNRHGISPISMRSGVVKNSCWSDSSRASYRGSPVDYQRAHARSLGLDGTGQAGGTSADADHVIEIVMELVCDEGCQISRRASLGQRGVCGETALGCVLEHAGKSACATERPGRGAWSMQKRDRSACATKPALQRSLIVSSGGYADCLFSTRCVRFRSSECVESNRLKIGTR